MAPEGVAEAISAGRLLKKNNVEFDVVYTSWLSRAIETVAVVVAAAVVTVAVGGGCCSGDGLLLRCARCTILLLLWRTGVDRSVRAR